MDQRSPAWYTQQLASARPMPLVVLRTPKGDHIYGLATPDVGQALSGGAFDADVAFDASRFFDAQGIVLEESDRLLDLGGITSTLRAIDGAVLGSYTATERPTMTAELANGDKAMSLLVGREYLLGQTLVAYVTFPGLDVLNAMIKRTATIATWTLTKGSLLLEADAL